MMDDITKITLSDTELDKVKDKEWILTKLRITEKVYDLFGMHAATAKEAFLREADFFGVEVTGSFPKISRGENYQLLPYVMLDYPSVFGKDHIFAMRMMFWWGNFFSCTLILKGHYKDRFIGNILSGIGDAPKSLFICISENEWEHHFETDNYLPVSPAAMEGVKNRSFIKIAFRFDLGQWNEMPLLLKDGYETLIRLMKDQLPRR